MSLSAETLALIKGAKNKYSRNEGEIKKPRDGKTRIRVLPVQVGGPLAQPGQFWLEYGVHWIKTEINGKPVAVVGNSEIVYGKTSEIDRAIEAAIKGAVSDDDLKLMKDWKAKKGILLNVEIRSGPDASTDAVPFELTPTTFGQLLSMVEEYAPEHGNILDYKTGFDFVIERTGKGLETRYTVMPMPGAKPVAQATIDKAVDLFALVEKQFFRGDEPKALNAIANMTGVRLTPAIAGSASTTGLLTGSSGRVAGAVIDEEAAKAADEVLKLSEAADKAAAEAAAAVKKAEAASGAPSKAELLRRQLEAAEAEEKAEAEAAAKVTAKAAAKRAAAEKNVEAAPSTAPTLDDEAAGILAELDNI